MKWIETRTENMAVSHQGRDQIAYTKMGAKSDGTITAFHVKIMADFGAYNMLLTPLIPSLGAFVMGGCYKIPNVQTDIIGVFTNKCPTDAIRGAGRPEATHMLELTLDAMAHELGIDRLEIRRKNFIPKEDFPAEVATGVIYDSGDYVKTLDKLLEHVDVAAFAKEQAELREQGVYRGIGFCTYTEICGLAPSRVTGPAGVGVQAGLWESAMVRVHNTGAVTVYTGTSPHGQGLDTAMAQIVADKLGVDPAVVEVIHGDTATGPEGRGTYGSRSLATGGEAVARATDKVVAKAKAIVAAELEAAPEDIEVADGKFSVKGSPDKGMAMADIAGIAYIGAVPEGMEPGLEETTFYDPENFVFPFGAHACVVDVDPDTGKVKVVRYVAVDDCGHADQPDADRRPGPRRASPTGSARPCTSASTTTRRASWSPAPSSTTRCPPRPSCPASSSTAPRPPRRSTRSASRASARRARSPPRRRSPTPCSTRCARSASSSSTCRSARCGSGRPSPRPREVRHDPRRVRVPGARVARGGDPRAAGERRGRQAAGRRPFADPADEAAPGRAVAARRPAQGSGAAQRRAPERRLADRGDDPACRAWSTRPSWGSSPRWRRRSPIRRCATAARSAARWPTATPASDLPAAMLITEAEVTLQGPDGQRTVAAADLFQDYLTTAVGPEEVLTEIRVPALDGYGHGYQKFNRRSEDWAMVAVCAVVKRVGRHLRGRARRADQHGARCRCARPRSRTPCAARSSPPRPSRAAAEQAAEGTSPPADLNASADYKRHLARVMCRRALEQAAG